MNSLISPEPKIHKKYTELVEILNSRGMIILNNERAEKKLSQVGYYRLSGFWHNCRKIKKNRHHAPIMDCCLRKPVRLNDFNPGTDFNDIFQLYLFDKKLRLLMLDAIERIEINIRSVIAHEVGSEDTVAYEKDSFISDKSKEDWEDKKKNTRNDWIEWSQKHAYKIKHNKEDCIKWYKNKNGEIPFWVVVEIWDFGTMSKYFEMLNRKYQNQICTRLDIDNPSVLKQWLREINTLRNRCAHHSRIWNQVSKDPLPTIRNDYFNNLNLNRNELKKIYGLISILWFLVNQIGPNSDWIEKVAILIESMPLSKSFSYGSMGFGHYIGFPRDKFNI